MHVWSMHDAKLCSVHIGAAFSYGWVWLKATALCHLWYHNLHMSLWTKSTTSQEIAVVEHAQLIGK